MDADADADVDVDADADTDGKADGIYLEIKEWGLRWMIVMRYRLRRQSFVRRWFGRFFDDFY